MGLFNCSPLLPLRGIVWKPLLVRQWGGFTCGRLWLRDAGVCQGPGHLREETQALPSRLPVVQPILEVSCIPWGFSRLGRLLAAGREPATWERREAVQGCCTPVAGSGEPFPAVWLSRVGCPDVPQAWSWVLCAVRGSVEEEVWGVCPHVT